MSLLGDVNMGLNGRAGGFGRGADHNLFDRGRTSSYGLSSPLDGVTVTGNVGLLLLQQQQQQQHVNDFIQQNSSLQTGLPQAEAVTSCLMGGATYNSGATSMGFSQAELERSLLFDKFDVEVLPQVAEHENHHFSIPAVSSSVTSAPVPFASVPVGVRQVGVSPMSALQPQVLISSRESWVEATGVASPRGVNRDGAEFDGVLDPINSLQPRQNSEKSGASGARGPVPVEGRGRRQSELQADHILRERQRRDDMTSKFAVLESLLPIGVKRDRSTIVDDSIEFVKNLHHRIKLLERRKVELEQASNETHWKGPTEVHRPTALASPNKLKATRRPPVSQEELSRIRAVLKSGLESMQVHEDLPHQVVIEMVCRPQPRLHSSILQCLERLNLDVLQCTTTKVSHRLICVITAKVQEVTTPTSGIVAALKYAMGLDVQSS